MIDQGIRWLGAQFSPEANLFWLHIQCLAWSVADLVIIFNLLRIANLARRMAGARPHMFSYVVLGLTMLFVPVVAVAPNGGMLFALELIITVPHFLIILYVLAVDARGLATALHQIIGPPKEYTGDGGT